MARNRTRVDVATERVLLKVVHAVIRDDKSDFEAQLQAFESRESLLVADARCTELSALIMIHQGGGALGQKAVQELAVNTATLATWSGISAAHYAVYINAIFDATPIETVMDLDTAVRCPFILLTNLVLNFRAEDEAWHEYLDKVWNALEDGQPQR